MSQKLEKEEDDHLVEYFKLFRSSVQLSTLASWIHEHIANRVLCTNARRDLLFFQAEGLTNLTDKAYYVPERSNFPLFDSFLVERRVPETIGAELILWIFPMFTWWIPRRTHIYPQDN